MTIQSNDPVAVRLNFAFMSMRNALLMIGVQVSSLDQALGMAFDFRSGPQDTPLFIGRVARLLTGFSALRNLRVPAILDAADQQWRKAFEDEEFFVDEFLKIPEALFDDVHPEIEDHLRHTWIYPPVAVEQMHPLLFKQSSFAALIHAAFEATRVTLDFSPSHKTIFVALRDAHTMMFKHLDAFINASKPLPAATRIDSPVGQLLKQHLELIAASLDLIFMVLNMVINGTGDPSEKAIARRTNKAFQVHDRAFNNMLVKLGIPHNIVVWPKVKKP